jgi:hypothetical protein
MMQPYPATLAAGTVRFTMACKNTPPHKRVQYLLVHSSNKHNMMRYLLMPQRHASEDMTSMYLQTRVVAQQGSVTLSER